MEGQQKRTVVLGNFDGIHLGHQQLLALGRETADAAQERLTVFTFYPQIQAVFQPDFAYLLSEEEKKAFFYRAGVEEIVIEPFNDQIAHMTPEQFVEEILQAKLHAGHVLVGFNYTFGYLGRGDAKLLKALCGQRGIEVIVMEPFQLQQETVSSTAIRQALKQGDVANANRLLGYTYHLCGTVVHGNKIGRTMGFPTANICPPENILLPANGVYAVRLMLDGLIKIGISNIGVRPTVDNNLSKTVEVHILDFAEDLYGRRICIEFCHFLRGEVRFAGLDALKEQLTKDKRQAMRLFCK